MKRIFLYISILLTAACEKEVDVEYPDAAGRLTLNCVLTPGDTSRAMLSSTIAFEELAANPYYKDALILLYEEGALVDTFFICSRAYRESAGDSVWQFCSTYPVMPGREYEVRAFKEGYSAVSGSTRVPQKPRVISIETEEDEMWNAPFEISIEDTSAAENFYVLQLTKQERFEEKPRVATLTTEDPTIALYSYFGIVKLPLDPDKGNSAFFTDRYFNGNRKLVKLRATFNSNTIPERLVLYSVSEEYYEYLRTLEINKAVSENPFSEPLRVKSNISNGFGVVGASNVTEINF